MIKKITIKNFKAIKEASFNLDETATVLVGPNNSGKTSILQALTMWYIGAAAWRKRRTQRMTGDVPRGVGVPISRLPALSVPESSALWNKSQTFMGRERKPMSVEVSGITGEDGVWKIDVEFTYQGRHIINARPVLGEQDVPLSELSENIKKYMPKVAFLLPMSGVPPMEEKLLPGSIEGRLGVGKTGDVLRNVCYQLLHPDNVSNFDAAAQQKRRVLWERLRELIRVKFFVELGTPTLTSDDTVEVIYKEGGKTLDLSAGGRGFQQTLMLLAYLFNHPGSVVLLDEPDAHLEKVRQHDVFPLICDVARDSGSQLIIASHSEVIMREAANNGRKIISTVEGVTEELTANTSTVKLLTDIGADIVHEAKIRGHLLFVEGSTDISILSAFAEILPEYGKERAEMIRRANVEYIQNTPSKAKELFYQLKTAFTDLRGFALIDNDDQVEESVKLSLKNQAGEKLPVYVWGRREIENYFPLPSVLKRYAEDELAAAPLLTGAMENIIKNNTTPRALGDPADVFWRAEKITDNYMDKIFGEFAKKFPHTPPMNKSDYYRLIKYIRPEEVHEDVKIMLERIFAVIDPKGRNDEETL